MEKRNDKPAERVATLEQTRLYAPLLTVRGGRVQRNKQNHTQLLTRLRGSAQEKNLEKDFSNCMLNLRQERCKADLQHI